MRPIFSSRGSRQGSRFNHSRPDGSAPSRIIEHLHIGGELGPGDWKALVREGVSVVINMQRERQDHFRSLQAVDAYLWLPVTDGWAPSMEQLQMGVSFVREAVMAGKGVFVHCRAGRGRGPLLCVCYLLERGFALEDALARVTAARPHVQLSLEQQIRLHEYAVLLQGERERIRQEAEAQANAAEARALAALTAQYAVDRSLESQSLPDQIMVAPAPAAKPIQSPAHSLSRDIFEFAGLLQSAFRTPSLRTAKKKPRMPEKPENQPSDSPTPRAMSNGKRPQ